MADRRVTVVNPGGYQEQLPDTDNLLLTLAPTEVTHGTNKLYVDTAIPDALASIDFSLINQQIDDLENDLAALTLRVTTIEDTYATETYVDAGDQSLQDQIDAIIAQGEIQDLQMVTDIGTTTTNDMTSTGTITAATLIGDMDFGSY